MSGDFNEVIVGPASGLAGGTIARGQPITDAGGGGFVVTGNGALAVGIALNDAVSGESVSYALPGSIVAALSDGALAVGVAAASDAAGEMVAATTGEYILGSFKVAGVANTLSAFHFSPSGRVA